MCAKQKVIDSEKIRDVLVVSDIWADMEATCENSPWHREENVARHTSMMLDYYDVNIAPDRSPYQQAISRIAIMFHDAGKPKAREVITRPDGTTYQRFGGHEIISARIFEDFYAKNIKLFDEQGFTPEDFYRVMFIIEHHLPFSNAGFDKQKLLRQGIQAAFGQDEDCYFDVLESDQNGRTSDDQIEKLKNFNTWFINFYRIETNLSRTPTLGKQMFILIGASGSGKSTFLSSHTSLEKTRVYSWDTLRLEFTKTCLIGGETKAEAYAKAWEICNKHSTAFQKYVSNALNEMLNNKNIDTIWVDNTSTSRKSRRALATQARAKGYFVTGILFPNSKDTLMERMRSRSDKSVPEDAVLRQWENTAVPVIGDDVDDVWIVRPA